MESSGSTAIPFQRAWIILGALIAGLFCFTCIALFVDLAGDTDADMEAMGTLLSYVMLALALGEIPVYLLVRKGVIARVAKRREDALEEIDRGLLPVELMGLALIGSALAEAVGLFGVTIYMVSGDLPALAAPVLAAAAIALQMPGRSRAKEMVEKSGRQSY